MHDRFLASAGRMAIQALVDGVKETPTFTLRIEHSADRINWSNRNASAEISAALDTTATNDLAGQDAGTNPGLRYVRLRLQLTGGATPPRAHVKVFMTAWPIS